MKVSPAHLQQNPKKYARLFKQHYPNDNRSLEQVTQLISTYPSRWVDVINDIIALKEQEKKRNRVWKPSQKGMDVFERVKANDPILRGLWKRDKASLDALKRHGWIDYGIHSGIAHFKVIVCPNITSDANSKSISKNTAKEEQ